jgi:hypothetical protein
MKALLNALVVVGLISMPVFADHHEEGMKEKRNERRNERKKEIKGNKRE